jgi:hypothetical protein
MENFPQEAGKLDASIWEFTEVEGLALLGEIGNEKFCTKRNFPGLPGLGIMERGEDWYGPMEVSIRESG